MPFQFQCPQGHLLEGEPQQAGQTCNCPLCGVLFIIPPPAGSPQAPVAPAPLPQSHSPAPMASGPGPESPVPTTYAPAAHAPASHAPASPAPTAPAFPFGSPSGAPGPPGPPNPGGAGGGYAPPEPAAGPPEPPSGPPTAPKIPGVAAAPAEEEEELLHIPCPNGHELETPRDMLGQEVLCPHCEVQFQLRERDSVEFKRRRDAAREKRDQQVGEAWFKFAVVMAVVVVVGLLGLFIAATFG